MVSRLVIPVGVILAGSPVAVSRVFAAESESEGKEAPCAHCHAKKTMKPSQLPIYGEPSKPDLLYIPEPTTAYHEWVSSARQTTWSATEGLQGYFDRVKDMYGVAKEHTKETKRRIQEDAGVLQRAGIISVAGLGGVVAGYKGGVLRKALFSGVAMTTAAAICYPNQTVDISKAGWARTKQEALTLWKQVSGKPAEKNSEKPKAGGVPAAHAEAPAPKDKTIMQEKGQSSAGSSPEVDHGQSVPEDKDLYTTRS